MSKLYKAIIKVLDNFVPTSMRPFWNHAAGPKTIFFWAPLGKWCLVIAGLGDLNRPAESISVRQQTSLAVTCVIWSRYSLVITPRIYSLLAVNVFVACTSMYQLSRAYRHHLEQEKKKEAEKKK